MMRMVGRKILAATGMAKAAASAASRNGNGFRLEPIEPRVLLSADVLSAVLAHTPSSSGSTTGHPTPLNTLWNRW